MSLGFWRPLLAANILLIAAVSADQPAFDPLIPPLAPPPAPDPQPEGYAYGARGSHLLSAAVISYLDILPNARDGQIARITIRKGPDYSYTDPHTNGYPGCTLRSALNGDFFEDKDSAQVVISWKDRKGVSYVADNLAAGPTLDRTLAALWDLADPTSQDAACVSFPLPADAVALTVLVVYTDVLYAFSPDTGPEDGPAIIASWDAAREFGRWRISPRDDMGLGTFPDMENIPKRAVIAQIREIIQTRTGGRYTLQRRFNLGRPNPAERGNVIEYDSGYDIVPAPPPSSSSPATAASTGPSPT